MKYLETKVRESCWRLALYYEELTLLSLISLFSRVDDDDDDEIVLEGAGSSTPSTLTILPSVESRSGPFSISDEMTA